MTYDQQRILIQKLGSRSCAIYRRLAGWSWKLQLFTILCVLGSTSWVLSLTASEANLAPPQVDPNYLVLQAIQKAVWGPRVSCRIHQQTDMYDQQQIGVGHYSHSGGGEGQLELGMRFSTGRSQLYFEQLSDGRFVWSWSNDGNPRRRVFLDPIRNALGPLADKQNSVTSCLHLAVGGQAGLLRSLYHRYRWYRIFAGEVDGQPIWEMIGTLRQTPPSPAAQAPIDNKMFAGAANELLPTDARIRLIRGGDADLLPLRVEYFRRELDENGELKGHIKVSKIEYTDIEINGHFDESKFTFPDHTSNPIDETSEYLPSAPLAGTELPLLR